MRRNKILIAIVVAVVLTWAVVRATNMFSAFHVPTTSMEPTIKRGEYIFVSSLKSKALYSVVCYRMKESGGTFHYISRLCGCEGDEVEVRNGHLFLNGKAMDTNTDLKFRYKIPHPDFEYWKDKDAYPYCGDTAIANLTEREAKAMEQKIHPILFMASKGKMDTAILGATEQNGWNVDNMGPFKVPKGYCFIMGDNRDNSLDSRYKQKGFIKKEDIIGGVLNK